MLTIKNLHASINGKEILKGIDLIVNPVKSTQSWDPTVPEKYPFIGTRRQSGIRGNRRQCRILRERFVIARSRRPLSRRNFPEFPVSGRNSGGKYG